MLENKLSSGASLYFALMVMTVLLAMALGLSSIFIGQVKMMKEMGNSVIAFYAADAGIEKVLTNRANPFALPKTTLTNGATYQVIVTGGGIGNCLASNYCIKSIGTYQETKRAIEIMY